MEIKAIQSTGRPEPQFVVTATSETDKLLLNMFIKVRHHCKECLAFTLHGYQSDGLVTSFNFGWREVNDEKVKQHEPDEKPIPMEPASSLHTDLPEQTPVKEHAKKVQLETPVKKCTCKVCGKEFTAKYISKKICSKSCANLKFRQNKSTMKNMNQQEIDKKPVFPVTKKAKSGRKKAITVTPEKSDHDLIKADQHSIEAPPVEDITYPIGNVMDFHFQDEPPAELDHKDGMHFDKTNFVVPARTGERIPFVTKDYDCCTGF